MAYNMFRVAAILQGVMARAVAGNAASAQAVETGRRARPMAELGWKQVEHRRRALHLPLQEPRMNFDYSPK